MFIACFNGMEWKKERKERKSKRLSKKVMKNAFEGKSRVSQKFCNNFVHAKLRLVYQVIETIQTL